MAPPKPHHQLNLNDERQLIIENTSQQSVSQLFLPSYRIHRKASADGNYCSPYMLLLTFYGRLSTVADILYDGLRP